MALLGTDVDPTGDEGAPARLFQVTLAVQFLVMLVFAATWLPRAFRCAVLVLILQVAAAAVPITTIIVLES